MNKLGLHENIVQYFHTEGDRHFKYIIMELYDVTLHDYVADSDVRSRVKTSAKEIFHQAMNGLDYLHSLNIVHRDLKPKDILLKITHVNTVKVKISDFGHSIKLGAGESSFSNNFGHNRTEGRKTPEILKGNRGVSFNL